MAGGSAKPALVCVTGASGYVGSWVVKQLLEKGYTVRGTVRDAENVAKTAWIRKLAEGTPGTLELVSANLMEEGSFDKVVEGCEYVCHVAAVVQFKPSKDPQEEVVDPAVKGTKNVFSSILKAKCVKRVVMTSSVAALGQEDQVKGRPYNESDWNVKATIEDAYFLGKTLSEKLAWKIYEEQSDSERRFELVTILPSLVLGPVYHKQHVRSSPGIIKQLLDGSFYFAPNAYFNCVDVREVAASHIAALENTEAKGRYIVSSPGAYHVMKIGGFLKEEYGNAKLPVAQAPNFLIYMMAVLGHPQLTFRNVSRHLLQPPKEIDGSRVERELGIHYRDLKQSANDTAKSIVELGIVKI